MKKEEKEELDAISETNTLNCERVKMIDIEFDRFEFNVFKRFTKLQYLRYYGGIRYLKKCYFHRLDQFI
jgi:hypothetical protein